MPKSDITALVRANQPLFRNIGATVACGLCLLACARSAHAQQLPSPPSQIPGSAADLTAPNTIDEQHPEKSIPTPEQALKNPLQMGYLLMDLISRAEAATQIGDHGAAIRYYQAIAKAVPERAVSFAKLCKSYETVGERKQALDSCKEALGKGGVTPEDYARYVRLVLQQPEALQPAQIQELDEVIAHLTQQLASDHNGKVWTAQLACEIATRLDDRARLSSCTKQLAALAPKDARTLTFQWALALNDHDTEAGQAILLSAKQSGMPPAALAEMETQLSAERARPSAFMRLLREWGLWSAISLALGATWAVLMRKKSGLSVA